MSNTGCQSVKKINYRFAYTAFMKKCTIIMGT